MMTPKQILATHDIGDSPGADKEAWMKMSLEAASRRPTGRDIFSPTPGFDGGLLQRMKKHGFDESSPIVLNHSDPSNPTIHEGHHRLAVALKLFPNKPIPVRIVGQDYLDKKARTRKMSDYNSRRAFAKRDRLYEQAKEKQVPKPNEFGGKCAACGERLEAGQGKYIRVFGDPSRLYEKYHDEHLPTELR